RPGYGNRRWPVRCAGSHASGRDRADRPGGTSEITAAPAPTPAPEPQAALSTLTRDCPLLFPAAVSRGQILHVALQVRGELFGLECADLLYQPRVLDDQPLGVFQGEIANVGAVGVVLGAVVNRKYRHHCHVPLLREGGSYG